MPIFEYEGKKYRVSDEKLNKFTEEFPNAVTYEERGGKKYRVSAKKYNKFIQEFGSPNIQDGTTVERRGLDEGKFQPEYKGMDGDAYKQWRNRLFADKEQAKENMRQGYRESQESLQDRVNAAKMKAEQAKNVEMNEIDRFFAERGVSKPLQAGYTAENDAVRVAPQSVEMQMADMNNQQKVFEREEERRIDKEYTPKEVSSPSDIRENYFNRFSLTERGKQLGEELSKVEGEISNQYAKEYLQSDEYKLLQAEAREKGKDAKTQEELDTINDELARKVNKAFLDKYGAQIDDELQPYRQAYQEEFENRYGSQMEVDTYQLNKKQSADALSEMTAKVDGMLADEERAREEKADEMRRRFGHSGRTFGGVTSGRGIVSERYDLGAKSAYLRDAKKQLEQAQETLEAAKNGTFASGLGAVMDWDKWTFGVSDMAQAMNLNKVITKSSEGKELTEDEQALMDAALMNMTIQGFYADDLNGWYKAGQVTAESIPFMLEMIANPVSGSGNAMAKGLLKYGLKKYALTGAKNKTVKKAINVAANILGHSAPAAVMTGTTSAGRVAAGTVEHLNDNYSIEHGGDGLAIAVRNGKNMGVGEALARSAASTFFENQSEMIFNAFPGAKNALSKVTQGLLPGGAPEFISRLGATKIGNLWTQVRNNPYMRGMRKRAQIGGIGEEYLEEVYNNFANVGLGEMSIEDATSLENNVDTFLGLVPTQLFFSAMGVGGYAVARRKNNKAIERYRGMLTEDVQREVEAVVNEAIGNPERLNEYFVGLVMDESLTPEQRKGRMELAVELNKRNLLDGIEEAKQADEPTRQEAAMEAGVAAENPEEKHSISRRYEDAVAWREKLTDEDGQFGKYLDDGMKDREKAVNDMMTNGFDDRMQEAFDYWDAMDAYEGMAIGASNRVDEAVADANWQAARRAHVDGRIIEATTADRGIVHVKGGNIVWNDDGTVNVALSDPQIFVVNEEGRIEMMSPRHIIQAAERGTLQAQREYNNTTLREQLEKQEADEVELNPNTPPVAPGLTYTDEQGNQMVVMGVQDGVATVASATDKNAVPAGVPVDEIRGMLSARLDTEEGARRESEAAVTAAAVDGSNGAEPSQEEVIRKEVESLKPENRDAYIERRVADLKSKKKFAEKRKRVIENKVDVNNTAAWEAEQERVTGLNKAEEERVKAETDAIDREIALLNGLKSNKTSVGTAENEGAPVGGIEQSVSGEGAVSGQTAAETEQKPVDITRMSDEDARVTLYNKYGDNMKRKVAATRKSADKELEKAVKALAKAEDAALDAPIGSKEEEKADAALVKAREAMEEAKRKADFWGRMDDGFNAAQQESTVAGPERLMDASLDEPQTPEERAAEALGSGEVKLTQDSFKRETGYGDVEARGFIGLFAGADKGGMTIEQAAEYLVAQDGQRKQDNPDWQPLFGGDVQLARAAIIDVLMSTRTKGELRDYISNRRKGMTEEEARAEREAYEEWTMGNYGMTPEEYENYVQTLEESRPSDVAVEEIRAIFAEVYLEEENRLNNNDNGQERISESIEGSNEVLLGEQTDLEGGDAAISEGGRGNEIGLGIDSADAASQEEAGEIKPVRRGALGNEKKETPKPTNSRMDVDSNLFGMSDDTATRQDLSASSVGKGSENLGAEQGNEGKNLNEWGYLDEAVNYARRKSGASFDDAESFVRWGKRKGIKAVSRWAKNYLPPSEASKFVKAFSKVSGFSGISSKEDGGNGSNDSSESPRTREVAPSDVMGRVENIAGDYWREREEKRRNPLRERVRQWERALGVKVHVVERLDDVTDRAARRAIERGRMIAGWRTANGEVVVYMPFNASVKEIDKTVLHELVGHDGLRGLLGKERFDALCDKVWEMMSNNARTRYYNYLGVKDIEDKTERRRAAADEYMANLAEREKLLPQQKNLWNRIVEAIRELFGKRLGKDDILAKDNLKKGDIAELLRLSYRRMENRESENEVEEDDGTRFRDEKSALETASDSQVNRHQTVVSSADGAKVLNNLDNLAKEFEENESTQPKTVIGDIARALNMPDRGKSSQYKTFEAKNGKVFTIRLSNHNATVSNFDNAKEDEGISIVITSAPNGGMNNDGEAHIVEYYYNSIALRKAEGKPLAEIVKSIKQALYSGEYKDTTGLAQRQEVNGVRFRDVFHGSAAEFERFDHAFMNTGEGNQSFGWGTYASEVEGVAVRYANAAQRNFVNWELMNMEDRVREDEQFVKEAQQELDYANSITTFENPSQKARVMHLRERGAKKVAEYKEQLAKDKAELEKWERVANENGGRYLYKIEIPDNDGSNYLSYKTDNTQESIDRANNAYRNMLLQRGVEEEDISPDLAPFGKGVSGESIYNLFVRELGNDKAASQFLNRNGFVGIVYPVNERKGGNIEGTSNYVIFNENDLQIKERTRFRSVESETIVDVPQSKVLYTDDNIGEKLYKVSGKYMKELYGGRGDYGRVLLEKGTANIDTEKARREYEQINPILDKYRNELVEMKYRSNEAAQKVINEVIADIDYSVQYYKELSEGKDVWRTDRMPRFREVNSLVAVHNISEENLRKVMDVGGLIMPSIAITKADMGHSNFGDISLLFDKSTINPSDRRNKVYGGDAWTPRFPEISAKLSEKVVSRIGKKIRELIEDRKLSDVYSLSAVLYPDNIERKLSRYGVEGYYGEEWMKLAYLLDSGKKMKVPMKMKDYGKMSETIIEMAKERGLKASDIQIGGFDFYTNNPDFVEAVHEAQIAKKLEDVAEEKREVFRKLMKKNGMSYSGFDSLVGKAVRMEYDLEHGGLEQIIDREALRESVEKKVKTNNADYNKWVDDLFEGIIEKYGIRNNRDPYTPSGYSRPWEQLYDAATPANILKHMLAENEQGGSGSFFDSNIMGASAESYGSIEEIREKGRRRLKKVDDEAYSEWSDSVTERMSEICDEFLTESQKNNFGSSIDAKIDITNAVAKDKTAKGIYEEMRRDYPHFTMEHAKRVEAIVKEIQNSAIGYFEAKPQRIVPLSEVRKAIVPSNVSKDILDGLNERGIDVVTYRRGNENSRNRLIKKESEGIRFREANENQAIFVSNAERAVRGIKQEKATPQQWLAMIEKNGGLKAGEDKWLGLSEWLKQKDGSNGSNKSNAITKQEILDFIGENKIRIEEVKYGEGLSEYSNDKLDALNEEFQALIWEGDEETGSVYTSDWVDYAWNGMVERYGDDFESAFEIEGNGTNSALVPTLDYNDEISSAAKFFLGIEDSTEKPINSVRLDYTTEGLENKREIALTVPTIEPWNESDWIHFGDAGEGRAVAWVRFGETTDADGSRVLVIDEIQSKRHQEGREKGYDNNPRLNEIRTLIAKKNERREEITPSVRTIYNENRNLGLIGAQNQHKETVSKLPEEQRVEYEKLGSEISSLMAEFNSLSRADNGDVLPAPFEKNWHELAMKRMLRLAAEEGFDKVAWTTGAQQAERYDLSKQVSSIEYARLDNGHYKVTAYGRNGYPIEGVPAVYNNKQEIAGTFGKEIAVKITQGVERAERAIEDHTKAKKELREKMKGVDEDSAEYESMLEEYALHDSIIDGARRAQTIEGDNLSIGGEGMKGFYDKMLPSFVQKYVKKWGAKVGEVELPELEESARKMWSVDVTPEMKESVMEGQTMFREITDDAVRGAVEDFAKRYNAAPVEELPSEYGEVIQNLLDDGYGESEAAEIYEELKNTPAIYDPVDDKIYIFAGKVPVEDVEEVLIHENTHRAIEELLSSDEKAELANALDELHPTLGEKIRKSPSYKDSDFNNEIIAYSVQFGHRKGMESYLGELAGDKRIQDILKFIGYDGRRKNRAASEIGEEVPVLVEPRNTGKSDSRGKDGRRNTGLDTRQAGVAQSNDEGGYRGRRNLILDEVVRLEEELGSAVNAIDSFDALPEGRAKDAIAEGRKVLGWYQDGRVYVYMPNARSASDVRATVYHEVVGHLGLRELLGDRFNKFLDRVYMELPADVRAELNNRAMRKGWDFREATEEYMAELAERFARGEKVSGLRKVLYALRDAVVKALRSLGIDLGFEMSDNYLMYVLWASKQNLKPSNVMGRIADRYMRDVLNVDGDVVRAASYHGMNGSDGLNGVRYRGIEEVNERFNEQLEGLTEQNAREKILDLGVPSDILLSCGIENKHIRLYGAKLLSKIKKHGYSLSDIKDLPNSLISPIAVFRGSQNGSYAILTELHIDGNNVLVSLSVGKGGHDVDFNVISSIYGKNNDGVIRWINDGKLLYVNKRKALNYLSVPAPIAGAQDNQELVSAAKVIRNFENPKVEGEKDSANGRNSDYRGGDLRFREVEPEDDVTRMTREAYEKNLKSLGYRMREGFQDSMLALKELQEAIVKTLGHDLEEYEDAYVEENHLSSKNTAEFDYLTKKLYKPLIEVVHELMKGGNMSYQDVLDYLNAKHGIERNRDWAVRDALNAMRKEAEDDAQRQVVDDMEQSYYDYRDAMYEELENGYIDFDQYCDLMDAKARDYVPGYDGKEDYSGLSSVFGEAGDVDAEWYDRARGYVRNVEGAMPDVAGKLWEAVRSVNQFSLDKAKNSGTMSVADHQKISNQFKWYVPLRGFDETTAEEAYEYFSRDSATGAYQSTIKKGRGRKSVAADMIATMMNVAQSTIMHGNKNQMKQKFLNLVMNSKTGLVTVLDNWYVNTGTIDDPIWEPAYPEFEPEDTAEEIAQAIEDFKADMEAKEKQGLAKKTRGGERIPYRTTKKSQLDEHIVIAKRNGQEFRMVLNGNPRAAQALNGLTNPDVNDGVLEKLAQKVNPYLASVFTTKNPTFIARNLIRDSIMSGSSVMIKESFWYGQRFRGNQLRALGHIAGLLRKYNAGTLDMNNPMELYFKEFIENGAETGYSQLWSVDKFKAEIEKDLERMNGGVKNGVIKSGTAFFDGLEFMNRCAEDMNRFAVYMTSRESGRSIQRSVHDAKEVTVNFNKKGAGTKAGGWVGTAAQFARTFYLFFNAAVQGLTNYARMAKEHPAKFAGIVSLFAAWGGAMPILNAFMEAVFGDDDDKDTYNDLPEWVRRNNACLFVPFAGENGTVLTLPLPIELRAIYGLGEAVTQIILKNETKSEAFASVLGQFMEMAPVNPLSGGVENFDALSLIQAVTPTIFQPVVQHAQNKDWTGRPIYKNGEWLERYPEYTKVYANTPQILVQGSKLLNDATGGNAIKQGWAQVNPAIVEHYLSGYTGGVGTTIMDIAKSLDMFFGDEPFDFRNIPVVKAVVQTPTERNKYATTNKKYYELLDELKQYEHEKRGYKRMSEEGGSDAAMYMELYRKMHDTETVARMKGIKAISNQLKELKDMEGVSADSLKMMENELRKKAVELYGK